MKNSDQNIEDLVFEVKDAEIFRIPDTRTRLDTLQNYFFPRLELLLRHTSGLIKDIYGFDVFDRMTIVYRPSHRRSAKENVDFGEVHIGLSGKRDKDRVLTVKRPEGTPFALHVSYLTFTVDPVGGMRAVFLPFRQNVDQDYVTAIGELFLGVRHQFKSDQVLCINHINANTSELFLSFRSSFSIETLAMLDLYPAFLRIQSPRYHFPLSWSQGLPDIILAFAALYPFLDASVAISEGRRFNLSKALDDYRIWLLDSDEDEDESDEDDIENDLVAPDLPLLDNYTLVRPGLWWSILARDNWTCCSCSRSAKRDGVVLEVDHILPRSRGGTDDVNNLQTLCKKCNLGKSNRDSTDLRRIGQAAL